MQPDALEQRPSLRFRPDLPIEVESAGVPRLSQLPALAEGHGVTARYVTHLTPAIDVLFRPEESDRRSSEPHVLPEVAGGHSEVDDEIVGDRPTVADLEVEHRATVRAKSTSGRVHTEQSRDG